MAIDAIQLLKQLAAAGPVGGAGSAPAQGTAGVDAASFAELLSQAREGKISSALPVTVRAGAQVSLSADQLARISLAADRAESAGLRNALILIDGQRVVLDVHARQVTGAATAENGVVGGIDGVLDLGNSGALVGFAAAGVAPGAQGAGFRAGANGGLVQNASLARLLQTIQEQT